MTVVVAFEVGRIAGLLERRFPGACVWWGERTGSWWAVTRDRHGQHCLLEAASPAEMARRLEIVRGPRMTEMRFRTNRASPEGRARPVRVRPPRPAAPPRRPGLLRRLLLRWAF
ncbi:hypothetical protein ACQP1W_51020 [Spirillospora sp. CA-255316]